MKGGILFGLFLVGAPSFSQPIQFQKSFGTNQLESGRAIKTFDLGYMLASNRAWTNVSSDPSDSYDVVLSKLDSSGNIVWSKAYSGPTGSVDYPGTIIQTRDSGYIMSMTIFANTPQVSFPVLKLDQWGNILWIKENLGTNIIEMNYGYAFGTSTRIIKTDPMGNILWARNYYDGFNSVMKTADEGFILSGGTYTNSSGGPSDRDIQMAKLDSNGVIQWSKVFGTANANETSYGICQSQDGGFALVGSTTFYQQSTYGDIVCIKTDALGNPLWMLAYPSQGGTTWPGKIFATLGVTGYVILGYSNATFDGNPLLGTRSFVIRTDLLGNFIWGKLYGDMASSFTTDWLKHGEQTSDGFIFSGLSETLGNGGGGDAWLVKTDIQGVSGCNEQPVVPTQLIPPFVVGSGMQDSILNIGSVTPSYLITASNWTPPTITHCYTGPIVTGVAYLESEKDFSFNPNPSSGIFQVNAKDWLNGDLMVYAGTGQMVFEGKVSEELMHVNISDLSNGIYFIRLSKDSRSVSGKIVKF